MTSLVGRMKPYQVISSILFRPFHNRRGNRRFQSYRGQQPDNSRDEEQQQQQHRPIYLRLGYRPQQPQRFNRGFRQQRGFRHQQHQQQQRQQFGQHDDQQRRNSQTEHRWDSNPGRQEKRSEVEPEAKAGENSKAKEEKKALSYSEYKAMKLREMEEEQKK